MTSEIGANALCMLACVVSLCTHTQTTDSSVWILGFLRPSDTESERLSRVKKCTLVMYASGLCLIDKLRSSLSFFVFFFFFFFHSVNQKFPLNLFVRFWVSKQDWDSDVSIESINLNVEPVKEQEEPQSCADRLQQRLFRCVNLNGPKDKIDR